MNPNRLLSCVLLLTCAACAGAPNVPSTNEPIAFPGAEGYGRYALGGRGGRVIKVTHLGDDGPGSLRAAVQAHGPRTIVFDVSGYIDLVRDLDINRGFITIAGQTAPGDGITLRGHSLNIKADHVVVRYIRVRPGAAANIETDAISIFRGRNVIVDHCSASWATDETLSISPSRKSSMRSLDNITVQWSIIAESLNDSVHAKGKHGYGSLVRGSDGARYTMLHNVWAHHQARMPRPGNYLPLDVDPIGPLIDFRNNVFYNWGGNYSGYNADTESTARYSFVGNHYIAGPDSRRNIAFDESNTNARLYFSNNWMNGDPVNDVDAVLNLPPEYILEGADFDHGYRVAPAGLDAIERVLDGAGASLARDPIDRRIMADVRAGTGRIIDAISDTPGWPELSSGSAPRDSDGDGMPDAWETAMGLDPSNPADGPADRDGDGYTNLEGYLNSLVPGMGPS